MELAEDWERCYRRSLTRPATNPLKRKTRKSAKAKRVEAVEMFTAPGEIVTVRGGRLPLILIALTTFGAFLPVLQNGFAELDGQTLANALPFPGVGSGALHWIVAQFFSRPEPLTRITFGLDQFFWWSDPFGYHWTSLLLHAINATVFYFVALRLLALQRFAIAIPPEPLLKTSASVAALVFAIHPLRVEPVALVTARGEIIAGIFFLLSILSYLKAAGVSEGERRWLCWMAVSILAYGLSLVSTPAAIGLPVVLLVLDIYPLRRFGGSRGWFSPEVNKWWWQKVSYGLIAVGAAVHAIATSTQSEGANRLTHIFHIFVAPAFYLWKTILPLGFSPFYDFSVWSLVMYALASAAIGVLVFTLRRQSPALLAGFICYVVLLLHVRTGAISDVQVIADRYSYLSSLPFSLLVGGATIRCWNISMNAAALWPRFLGSGATVLLLIVLGALTRIQARVWHDSETLWKNAAAVSGSGWAHNKLASLFETQEKYDEAIASYRQAANIDPDRWEAHEKAALLLQKQGKIREAVEHFRSTVRINPNAIEARANLAAGLVTQGDVAGAVGQFRKVLELAPERNETRFKLGIILALQGRLTEAAELFQQVIKAEPGDAKALVKLGQVLAAQGHSEQAIAHFRQAVHIQPEDAEAHESLAQALVDQGKRDEAAKHVREALRILKSTPTSR